VYLLSAEGANSHLATKYIEHTQTMVPCHIPFIIFVMCATIICDDILVIQELIRSNLGPLLNNNDYISCSRMHTGLIECDVYAPLLTSYIGCKQLQNTFTAEVLSNILNTTIDGIQIDCQLPMRYINVSFN